MTTKAELACLLHVPIYKTNGFKILHNVLLYLGPTSNTVKLRVIKDLIRLNMLPSETSGQMWY